MKNEIISKYRHAAQTGGKKYWEAKNKLDELKSKEKQYYKDRYQELLAAATLEVSDAESEAKKLIAQAHEEAAALIKQKYALDGEQINENTVKLLKSGVVLTPAEVNNLMKNAKTVTMQRIISDYANEHGINTSGKFVSEKEALEELDALDGMARSGLQRDFYFNDVIADNDKFDTTAGEIITGESFISE